MQVPQGEAFVSVSSLQEEASAAGPTPGSGGGGIDLFQNYPKKIKSNTAGWSSIPSDTHSCISLKYCQSYNPSHMHETAMNTSKHTSTEAGAPCDLEQSIEPLSLSWSHPTIPLDSLHVSLRVAVPSATISSTAGRRNTAGSSKSTSGDKETDMAAMSRALQDQPEYMIGHCSIGLNRLCQTAAAAALARQGRRGDAKSNGVSTSVSVASILMRDGCPMYNIDKHSMQVCHHRAVTRRLAL